MRSMSAAAYQNDTGSRLAGRQEAARGFGQYVRVDMPRSSWVEKVSHRLNQLASLPRGWDGYFAPPIPFTNAAFAAALIDRITSPDVEAPQLVPGSDGRLQIEWHSGGYDIELEVLAPYKVIAMRENIDTGDVQEISLDRDFTVLIQWLSELGVAKAARA